ncbi:MAG: VWA domain-containing protein [Bacteroidales bacterium]|nr:VWA domain-containing protein [Bacteroidales bacterium]
MIRFENPQILYALFLLPLFILVFVMYLNWRNKALRSFGDFFVVNRLIPDASKGRKIFKFLLFLTAMLFLIFAMANLQIGSKLENVKRSGIDIIIALDVSNSMMAEDISPNRLERSKMAISRMIDKLENDRIGIIVFAGKSFTQLPLTHDKAAAKMMLSSISTNSVNTQGTAIGGAIHHAISSFDKNDFKNKSIIIISDGENHEDDPYSAAQVAQTNSILIHTIGIGSPEGVPIPLFRGNQRTGFRTDRDGNTVVTKLDEASLRRIASITGGTYVRATNTDLGLDHIFDEIKKMEKQEYESKVFSSYESRYPYFLSITILCLLLELFIFERKGKWFRDIRLFEVKENLKK